MSDTATVTPTTATPAATPPPVQNTIHDAVEALFAEKEASESTPTAVPVGSGEHVATVEKPDASDEEPKQEADGEKKEPEPAKEEAATASDVAIELAKAKKALARAKQKQPEAKPDGISPEMMKRIAAMQAAGGDTLKEFEAAGFDLAKVVQLYENRAADDPNFNDPLAAQVKLLSEKLTRYEEREQAANDEAAVTSFMRDAETFAQSNEETNFVAALTPLGGLENVKQRVLDAAQRNEVLTLADSVKQAEKDLVEVFEALAKTPKGKKMIAKLYPQMPKTPGIPPNSSKATPAPETQTPNNVADVISNAIDALGIE